MTEKEIVAKGLKLKWTGVFDLNELYRKIKFWLEWKGYGNEKDLEKLYVERIKPGGKQLEIRWEGVNEVSTNVKAVIEITFFVTGLQDVEVQKAGKTVKLKKGDIEMRFNAYLLLDIPSGILGKVYKRFVLKKELDGYKIDLYDDLYDLHDEIRGYLTLQRF